MARQFSFNEVAPGEFHAGLPRALHRAVLVEITLCLPPVFLEQFFRFARPKVSCLAPTFLNTLYAESPPGIRVGPWPGWRGIPEMPVLRLDTCAGEVRGKFIFLGDEKITGELRVTFACEGGLGRKVRLLSPEVGLRPMCAQILFNLPARAVPQSVALRSELRGAHPRLVVDAREVAALRGQLGGARAPHWQRMQALVKSSWNLPYETTPEGKVLPGPERLTGADRTLIAAAIALLRPERQAQAQRAFFAYLRETAQPDFGPLGIDTQSGEVLYVLCVAYDWLEPALSAAQRTRAKKRLWEIAAICRRHLDPARRDYAQAHYLGCGLGLLAFSFLFWDEHPEAPAWAAELRGALARVLAMLPADGFFPHGLNLWIYEHGFLLRWLELFRHCTGEDLWRATPYFAAASRFRAAATSPDGRKGVTFGDPQYRVTGDAWCHLLTARHTRCAAAQALGEQLLDQSPAGTDHRHAPPRRRVYELLWHLPEKKSRPVSDGVTSFRDGGQIFVRRGATLVTLRAGAPLGRQRRAAGEVGGYGHSDPCNGAVLVWRGGTFVGSGPGPLYRRDTALHNVVTINGRGQVGDSCVWFPDLLADEFIPPEPEIVVRGKIVFLRTELAAAYFPYLGVRRHTRTLEIAADGSLRGEDVIELGAPAEIAWRWHTWAQVSGLGADLELRGEGCAARLSIGPKSGLTVRVQPEQFVAAYPHEGTVGTEIVVARQTDRAVFQWELRWIGA